MSTKSKLFTFMFCFGVLFLMSQSIVVGSVEKSSEQTQEETKEETTNIVEDEISSDGDFDIPLNSKREINLEEKETPTIEIVEETIVLEIPEGLKLEKLAEKLEEQGFTTKQDFLRIANDRTLYDSLKSKYPSLLPNPDKNIRYLFEGYLLAGTYEVKESTTPSDLIEMMVGRMNDLVVDLNSKFPNHYDMSFSELLTLASIVEKESANLNDRRDIAGVFINRLETGMKMQSDVTVLYAHNRDGGRVLYKDLEIENPYNTYYVDFPIGPINSPSYNSIVSVFDANDNNYLFFFGTGQTTVFASTFEQHKENINAYR